MEENKNSVPLKEDVDILTEKVIIDILAKNLLSVCPCSKNLMEDNGLIFGRAIFIAKSYSGWRGRSSYNCLLIQLAP